MINAAIGAIRARLTLQGPVDATDDNIGVLRSYAPLCVVWANIRPAVSNDRFAGQQMEVTITHRIVLRYRTGVTGAMRLVTGSRVFLIHGVEIIEERARYLACHCEEIRP